MKGLGFVVLGTFLVATVGCCVAPPQILGPGTEREQQQRAQRYDPYPEPNMGPSVDGGRPRDFQAPRAEVLRVQPRRDEPLAYPPPPGAYPR
jgi:hypothetical protein